jgi:hypothetical protein
MFEILFLAFATPPSLAPPSLAATEEVSPSERVMQSDQSFQLRGLGNNPTNRDEYLREQLNE